ncbi:MAG: hypothetical protein AB8E82_03560 [Aureispira sp.]
MGKRKNISVGKNPPTGSKIPKIPSSKIKQSPKWAFSFEYYKQIPYFGLDRSDSKWFISLLEKLRELGQTQVDSFKINQPKKQVWRYHAVDWNLTNVPIKRSDLDWLPLDYLNNEDDFPILQFQVSKALGRVVGFWGIDSNVFYIVLLDPLHNIQPSGGKYGYKIDDCKPLSCQYSSILADIDQAKKKKTEYCEGCTVFEHFSKIPTKNNRTNFFAVFVDDDINERLISMNRDVNDILEMGLLQYDEEE